MAVETAGIFFFNKDYKLLVGHPTGHKANFWSIPKGKLDKGETSFEAALRETWEETNVDLGEATSTYELEMVKYKSKNKKLKSFVIFEDENRKIDSSTFELKCNSNVSDDAKWNAGLPEMDAFKWITLDEAKDVLHQAQKECLDTITQLIKEKNGERSQQKQETTKGN